MNALIPAVSQRETGEGRYLTKNTPSISESVRVNGGNGYVKILDVTWSMIILWLEVGMMLPMCVYYFYICHFKHWKCLESRNMKMFYITVLYTCILVYMWLLLPNVIGIPKFAVGSTMISYTEIHFQRWLQFCILRVRLKWWPWQGRQGSGQVINNSSKCWPTKCVGLIICIWIWFSLMHT